MNTSLVEAILSNLAQLLPWRIVHSYERGVLFRMGRDVAELMPGWHWFWPLFESIDIVNVAPETRNLPTQTVMSKDGKPVTFSANVCYRITNARQMFVAVQSFDEAMIAYAMCHLAAEIGTRTFAGLRRDREQLETGLADSLSEKVAAWGAEIEWVGITDLANANAYRLFGDAGGLLPV